jgi:NADH-quinone oxidoreductase subunit J
MPTEVLVQWLFFGILTVITLGSALMVVVTRNLFHSALWLLFSLFGVAGFYAMLAAPFLAAVQVLVYIGAIVILIIIAIMLTRKVMGLEELPNKQWGIAAGGSVLAFVALVAVLVFAGSGAKPLLPGADFKPADVPSTSIVDLGNALTDPGQYTAPFLLAAVFLTGAMIGAIVIAREDS